MLFVSSSRPRAVHIPAALPIIAVGSAIGVVPMVQQASWGGAAVVALIAVVAGYFALTETRRVRVEDGELTVANLLGTERMKVEAAALGIRVQHSARSGSTYTIYALDGVQQLDLASFASQARAERQRERLDQVLLAGRSPSERAARAESEVARREQRWRDAHAHAQQQVDAYYSSGKFRRAGWWVAGIVLLYSLAMTLYLFFSQ